MAAKLSHITITKYTGRESLPVVLDDEMDPQVGVTEQPEIYVIKVDGEPIGICTTYNPTPYGVEVGIQIAPEFRGKGYGSAVMAAFSSYCLQELGFPKVHLKVLPYNLRAIRAYEKAGFKRCGKIVVDSVEFIKMEKGGIYHV